MKKYLTNNLNILEKAILFMQLSVTVQGKKIKECTIITHILVVIIWVCYIFVKQGVVTTFENTR